MAMQRVISSRITTSLRGMAVPVRPGAHDIFINYRGSDTKRTVAGLLYDRLVHLNLRPFMDRKNLELGDRMFHSIGWAINNCKVGVAVFSPHYCESYCCLHELALLVQAKKKVIPIFCDVQPSDLLQMNMKFSLRDVERFRNALEEVRYTVGIVFDSQTGDWSDLLTSASDIIVKSLND